MCDVVAENGAWDWDRLRHLVLRHLARHIVALTPPSARSGPDRLAWKWSSQATFSSADTYKHLCTSVAGNVDPWNVIWKAHVPQRVRVFLWLLWHDKLLTNSVRRRHMTNNEFCPLCCSGMETRIHMIRDCSFSRRIWESVVPVHYQGVFFSLPFEEWFLGNLQNENNLMFWDLDWKSVFGILGWLLWKHRNL